MTQMKVKYCYDCDGIYKATYEECPTCSARKQCVALTAQNASLQAQVDGNGMLLTAISMIVGDRPGLVEAVQQLKKERDDFELQLEDRADSEYHLRETLKQVNAENQRLKEDLKDIKGAFEYLRKRALSIYNNTRPDSED